MRIALRTSIVTAALAGALLAPAAAPAFAAPAAAAAPQATAPANATASDDDRYAGEPVYIGEGLVAVLRNEAEGPEAWIRFVGSQWKPGDPYMVRVLTVLERSHPGDTVNGLLLKLTKADTAAPVLTVTKDGVTASYPLPKGTGVKGAGKDGGSSDATHAPVAPKAPEAPKAPQTAAVQPVAAALPSTAEVQAPVQAPEQAPQQAQGAQILAAPQGPVAADADLAAADADTDDTTTAAAGAGLVAIVGGLWAARAARTRRGRNGA
ncbi:hypothetical protein ABZ924_00170 [Streptomyces sp. NPDC046876]|uniref:hypothetical protein n=1 Tax=Streptomyces sp. NPDC046876 TaxID=3155616 RepID=UPI0033DDDECF